MNTIYACAHATTITSAALSTGKKQLGQKLLCPTQSTHTMASLTHGDSPPPPPPPLPPADVLIERIAALERTVILHLPHPQAALPGVLTLGQSAFPHQLPELIAYQLLILKHSIKFKYPSCLKYDRIPTMGSFQSIQHLDTNPSAILCICIYRTRGGYPLVPYLLYG